MRERRESLVHRQTRNTKGTIIQLNIKMCAADATRFSNPIYSIERLSGIVSSSSLVHLLRMYYANEGSFQRPRLNFKIERHYRVDLCFSRDNRNI